MESLDCFDSELQMFRVQTREPSLNSLRFWRWLAEQHELEHDVFGPPVGVYAGYTPEDPD